MLPGLARVLIAATIAAAATGAGAAPAPAPLKAWREGPVRLLLTADEYDRFGSLRTDEERRAFIDTFWNDLQAVPGAAGKDFRATFEARCKIADARYETVHESGWRTLRGRVYILLGEPVTVRHESGGPKAIDKEVWVYSGLGDHPASVEIAFYRCIDGSYRSDPSCEVVRDTGSVSFDWERSNYLWTLRNTNPNISTARLQRMLVELLAALPRSVPPPSPRRPDAPAAPPREPRAGAEDPGRLEAAPYYFRAQDGSVLVFVTLAMRDGGQAAAPADAGYLAAASFERVDRKGARVADSAVHTTPLTPVAHDGGPPSFFGRAYLEPGSTYAARYALQDDRRGEIVVKDERLSVPDLTTGLSASSLVPAERFGPAESGSGPYRVGSEEVVPRVGASFRRSELLRIYLQVYGAAIDPARAAARVDVVFKFQRVVGGATKRFGKPFSVRDAAGGAMGLALPIGEWPLGSYRVRVELHDRVAGERVSVDGAFTIVE